MKISILIQLEFQPDTVGIPTGLRVKLQFWNSRNSNWAHSWYSNWIESEDVEQRHAMWWNAYMESVKTQSNQLPNVLCVQLKPLVRVEYTLSTWVWAVSPSLYNTAAKPLNISEVGGPYICQIWPICRICNPYISGIQIRTWHIICHIDLHILHIRKLCCILYCIYMSDM